MDSTSQMGIFQAGDLVRSHIARLEGRFFLVLRKISRDPRGIVEWECWDPKVRGYTRIYDHDLRVVSRYSDREMRKVDFQIEVKVPE